MNGATPPSSDKAMKRPQTLERNRSQESHDTMDTFVREFPSQHEEESDDDTDGGNHDVEIRNATGFSDGGSADEEEELPFETAGGGSNRSPVPNRNASYLSPSTDGSVGSGSQRGQQLATLFPSPIQSRSTQPVVPSNASPIMMASQNVPQTPPPPTPPPIPMASVMSNAPATSPLTPDTPRVNVATPGSAAAAAAGALPPPAPPLYHNVPPNMPPPQPSSANRPRLASDKSEPMLQIAPAHPFFSASFYEDDNASDGNASLIFQTTQSTGSNKAGVSPSPRQQQQPRGGRPSSSSSNASLQQYLQQQQNSSSSSRSLKRRSGSAGRERFPSVDSMGSNSSVRYLKSKNSDATAAPQTAHPPAPRILPYHLRKQRGQQQKSKAAKASTGMTKGAAPPLQQPPMIMQQPGPPRIDVPPPLPSYAAFHNQPPSPPPTYPQASPPPPPPLHHYPPNFAYPPSYVQPNFFPTSPIVQQQQQHYHRGMPPMPPSPYQQHPPPSFPQRIPSLPMPYQFLQHDGSSGSMPYPYPMPPLPYYQQQMPQVPAQHRMMRRSSGDRSAERLPSERSRLKDPPPPPPPPPSPLPPPPLPKDGPMRGLPLGLAAATRARARSSSLDDSSDNNNGRPPPSPPPPPPPTLPPPTHVRHDSSSSVSSLGTSGRDEEEELRESLLRARRSGGNTAPPLLTSSPPRQGNGDNRGLLKTSMALPPARAVKTASSASMAAPTSNPPPTSSSNRSASFLANLNPWSPKVPNVKDYHRKNQAFLQRANSQKKIQEKALVASISSPNQMIRRMRAMDMPPATRGSHRRLTSIDKDDWNDEMKEGDEDEDESPTTEKTRAAVNVPDGRAAEIAYDGRNVSTKKKSSRGLPLGMLRRDDSSSDEATDTTGELRGGGDGDGRRRSSRTEHDVSESTRLLPLPGISSNELHDKSYTESTRSSSRRLTSTQSLSRQSSSRSRAYGHDMSSMFNSDSTWHLDNTTATAMLEYQLAEEERRRKKKKRRQARRKQREIAGDDEEGDRAASSAASISSSKSSSSREFREFMRKRHKMLKKEKARFKEKWRAEARAEQEDEKRRLHANRWQARLYRYLNDECGGVMDSAFKFFAWAESFIGNLPLTIGAIALAFANLGVDWFKFMETNLDSCQPVHFHSSQCTFPEFPGCFYCDTNSKMYKIGVNFHYACSAFAGLLASTFLAKLLIARRVVCDELSSPTTATPAGHICMTLEVVFAGRGLVGEIIVAIAATVHLCLATWFIYMALAYHIMPEPSWFPNTVSIGISAVKVWLYFPMAGHFLMAVREAFANVLEKNAVRDSYFIMQISLSLNMFFFPISLIRVYMNRKISATVGWMQMSAPNVSLYALTLMAQPSFEEEHPDINQFQRMHRMVYLPVMHFFFAMCLAGMCASVYSLAVRWKDFRKVPFSPAHAAFCVPTLSHANAIQAYLAAVNAFSGLRAGHPFKQFLYGYWVFIIALGTTLTLTIGTRFLLCLPAWTHVDTEGEQEPPAPYNTAMTASNLITTGETLVQSFVSPAILQANEAGALVVSRNQQGEQVYRRTRKVTALGFEPIMNEMQLDVERELLLEYVARNPPRRRHRTLSVPGVDFNYDVGTGNTGVFGVEEGSRRDRSNTMSPRNMFAASRGQNRSYYS